MKAIKKYSGGIHFLIQAAIREDGVLFTRTQTKTRYGRQWTPWRRRDQFNPTELPSTVQSGFSTLHPCTIYNNFNPRLQKD